MRWATLIAWQKQVQTTAGGRSGEWSRVAPSRGRRATGIRADCGPRLAGMANPVCHPHPRYSSCGVGGVVFCVTFLCYVLCYVFLTCNDVGISSLRRNGGLQRRGVANAQGGVSIQCVLHNGLSVLELVIVIRP